MLSNPVGNPIPKIIPEPSPDIIKRYASAFGSEEKVISVLNFYLSLPKYVLYNTNLFYRTDFVNIVSNATPQVPMVEVNQQKEDEEIPLTTPDEFTVVDITDRKMKTLKGEKVLKWRVKWSSKQ